jgi:hypothetical protein
MKAKIDPIYWFTYVKNGIAKQFDESKTFQSNDGNGLNPKPFLDPATLAKCTRSTSNQVGQLKVDKALKKYDGIQLYIKLATQTTQKNEYLEIFHP